MIPDITTGQRTYYLAVSSGQSFQTFDIPFRDTAGNIIKCNYVKIDAVGATAGLVGSFVAELSGLSRVGNMTLNQLSSVTNTLTPNTSGILGIGAPYSINIKGEAIWHGSNGEVCNGLKLRFNSNGTNSTFGITYGNLLPFNLTRVTGFSNVGQYPYPTEYDKGV